MKVKLSSRTSESPARLRRRKVSAVRRQLRQGRYDINFRLTAILDYVLEDLST